MMISYAQNFEDVVLWRVLKDIRQGRYVDVGAFHPEINSVTKWFYDQGWSGLNLEPVPSTFALLDAARPRDRNICAAAGATVGTAQMTVFPNSAGLSTLHPDGARAVSRHAHEVVDVDVRSLKDLLEPFAGEDIHFLKIDAEGSERDVLLGMDFSRFRPWIVVVEATIPGSPLRASKRWEDLILPHHYGRVYFDGLNEFFVAAEKKELAALIATPPNVFDQFELATTVREREGRVAVQASFESLSVDATLLQAALAAHANELAAVKGELSARESELAAVSATLAAAQFTIRANEQELNLVRGEMDAQRIRVEDELADMRSQAAEREAVFAATVADLAVLADALRSSREREAATAAQLTRLLNSRSWRWLQPARRLRALALAVRRPA